MELSRLVSIPDKMYFNIAEVAKLSSLKSYVLRYWETQFSVLSPDKDKAGRRQYTRKDVDTVLLIKELLYTRKYSIEGARKHMSDLKRQGQLKGALIQKLSLTEDQVEQLMLVRERLQLLLAACQ